jgi:hypothetical protein
LAPSVIEELKKQNKGVLPKHFNRYTFPLEKEERSREEKLLREIDFYDRKIDELDSYLEYEYTDPRQDVSKIRHKINNYTDSKNNLKLRLELKTDDELIIRRHKVEQLRKKDWKKIRVIIEGTDSFTQNCDNSDNIDLCHECECKLECRECDWSVKYYFEEDADKYWDYENGGSITHEFIRHRIFSCIRDMFDADGVIYGLCFVSRRTALDSTDLGFRKSEIKLKSDKRSELIVSIPGEKDFKIVKAGKRIIFYDGNDELFDTCCDEPTDDECARLKAKQRREIAKY